MNYYPQFGVPYLQVENYKLDKKIVDLLDYDLYQTYQFILLEQYGSFFVCVMVYPELKELIINILRQRITDSSLETFRTDENLLALKLKEIQKSQFNIDKNEEEKYIKWKG